MIFIKNVINKIIYIVILILSTYILYHKVLAFEKNELNLYKIFENNRYEKVEGNFNNIKKYSSNINEMKDYIIDNYVYFRDDNQKHLILKDNLTLKYSDENIIIINLSIDNRNYEFSFSNFNIINITYNSLYEINEYIIYKKNSLENYFSNILSKFNYTLKNYVNIRNIMNNLYDEYILNTNENHEIILLKILNNKSIYDLEILNFENIYFLEKKYNEFSEKNLKNINLEEINKYNYFNFNQSYYCLILDNYKFDLDKLRKNINFLNSNTENEYDVKLRDDNLIIKYNENEISFKLLRYEENKTNIKMEENIFIEKDDFIKKINENNNYNIDEIIKKFIDFENKKEIIIEYDKNIIKDIFENNKYDTNINLDLNITINNYTFKRNININVFDFKKDIYFINDQFSLTNFKVEHSDNLYFSKNNLVSNIYQKHSSNLKIEEDDIFEYYFLNKDKREFTLNYYNHDITINSISKPFKDITYISYSLSDLKKLYLFLEKQDNLNKTSLYTLLEEKLSILLTKYDIFYNNIINNDIISIIENSTNSFFEKELILKIVNKEKEQDVFMVNILFSNLKNDNKIDEEILKLKLHEKIEKLPTAFLEIINENNLESEIKNYIKNYINLENINYKVNYIDKLSKKISIRFLLNKNNKIYNDIVLNFNYKNYEEKSDNIKVIKNFNNKLLFIIIIIFYGLINALIVIYLILKKLKKI